MSQLRRWLPWVVLVLALIQIARRQYRSSSRIGLAIHVLLGRPLMYRMNLRSRSLMFCGSADRTWIIESRFTRDTENSCFGCGHDRDDFHHRDTLTKRRRCYLCECPIFA